MSHVHAFFKHTYLYLSIFWYWFVLVLFCVSLFLSLSLSFSLVTLWHLNENPLRLGTLFVSGNLFLLPPLILLHLTSGSVMIKHVRTFRRTSHDATFIQNAKSFYQTFPILTFPLSSTIEVESHYVASWSPVLPWSYRSFTPTCTDSTILYLILSLAFEVRAL